MARPEQKNKQGSPTQYICLGFSKSLGDFNRMGVGGTFQFKLLKKETTSNKNNSQKIPPFTNIINGISPFSSEFASQSYLK